MRPKDAMVPTSANGQLILIPSRGYCLIEITSKRRTPARQIKNPFSMHGLRVGIYHHPPTGILGRTFYLSRGSSAFCKLIFTEEAFLYLFSNVGTEHEKISVVPTKIINMGTEREKFSDVPTKIINKGTEHEKNSVVPT